MDTAFHAITGIILSNNISSAVSPLYTLSFAALPDILSISSTILISQTKQTNRSRKSIHKTIKTWFSNQHKNVHLNEVEKIAFRITHSFFILPIISLLAYFIAGQFWWIGALAYLSHIIIDIPTHQGAFATRVFWPISDMHFKSGINWWSNKKRYLFFWVIVFFATKIHIF